MNNNLLTSESELWRNAGPGAFQLQETTSIYKSLFAKMTAVQTPKTDKTKQDRKKQRTKLQATYAAIGMTKNTNNLPIYTTVTTQL